MEIRFQGYQIDRPHHADRPAADVYLAGDEPAGIRLLCQRESEVDHPRWSQASERRIGESGFFGASRHKTLPFNGYADEVASLYAGMDLRADF